MALSKILLGMLEDFKKDYLFEGMELSKEFEYLVNYLIISKFHPDAFSDKGDLDRVVVDKKSQFGLDAIAFIVNGNLVLGKDDIPIYAKSKKLDVDILFIQTKTEEKCDTGDLLKTIQATKNFLVDFDAITEKNSNILNAKEIYDELFKYENYRHCTTGSSAGMVNSLYDASQNIAQSMQTISLSTEKIVENITQQNHMTQNIQNAISTTQEYSSEMVSVASLSNENIRTNQKMMETLKEQSQQIADNNVVVTEAMEQLQENVDKVASIAKMILKISNETTILSLNASVESARAGEAGKGFSVIADQIRELAEETKDFTENITHIVDELNVNAKTVVNAVDVSLKAADSQNQMIGATAEAFDELSGNMNVLVNNVQEIGDRIDHLSTSNNQIVDSITQLTALSEEVSASAEQTNQLTGMNVNYAGQTWESIQKINQSAALLKNV